MRPLLQRFVRPIGALVAIALGVSAASGQMYRPIDLGSLRGWTEARAVNNAQTVVGSTVGNLWRYRGFVWDGDLGTLRPPSPFTQAEGMDINARSAAIFAVYSMGEVSPHAIRVQGGDTADLGAFCPRAINRAGSVVGTQESVDPATGLVRTHAVLWNRGALVPLDPLAPGADCSALDLSNNGRIVGSAFAENGLAPIAVLWRRGAITELGTLGRSPAQATSVSPRGRYAAGFSATASGALHAFRYKLRTNGTVRRRRDIGALSPGGWSVAYDVNNAADVVGTSDGRAFLFTRGRLLDLNTSIPASHGWTLVAATGINAGGDIVGWGQHGADGLRAFLLVRICSQADVAAPFGVLDAADRDAFLAAYNEGNIAEADLTGSAMPGAPGYDVPDGVVNADDLMFFLTLFADGC